MKKIKLNKQYQSERSVKRLPLPHRLKNLGMLVLAVVFYSVGVSFFFGPSGLTPGGLSGIAIAIDRFGFLPFGKGVIVMILNIPIIILGIVKFGPRFFATTIAAILASSGLMEVFDMLVGKFAGGYSIAPLPAAIGGGVLIGIAVGFVMRAGATFGGTDIIVKVLRLRYKYMQTGTFYLFVDGAVVIFGTVCALFSKGVFDFAHFNVEILIYSVMAIFVQSYFANFVLYGSEGARMIYIITTKEEEISERINTELHSGVTYLQGKGAYTQKDRQILMCAMRKQQVPGAREIVLQEDPDAFMIVTSASQVLGKGYKRLDEEEL